METSTGKYPTYSYTRIAERLQWLKSMRLQFDSLGYIAISPYQIAHSKAPILEDINRRINQRLNHKLWYPTRKRTIALERALIHLASDGEKWSALAKYHDQVMDHYAKDPDQDMDLNTFSNEYLIAFNRIYKKGL